MGEPSRDFERRRKAAYDAAYAERHAEDLAQDSGFDALKPEVPDFWRRKNQRLAAQGRKVANSLKRGPDGRLLPRRAIDAL
jgi:hypothetical protein